MARKSPLDQFYERRLGLKNYQLAERAVIYLLPCVLAAVAILGNAYFPDLMATFYPYITPVALTALTIVAYALLVSSVKLHTRRQAYKRLEELQAQYAIADELAWTGAWVLELDGSGKSGQFAWSKGCFSVFGIDPEHGEPSFKLFLNYIHRQDRTAWMEAHLGENKPDQGRIEFKYRVAKTGQDPIWLRSVAQLERDERGNALRLAGFVQNITKEETLSQELAGERNKYLTLTELSADWDWDADENLMLQSFSNRIDSSKLKNWSTRMIGKNFRQAEIFREEPQKWQALVKELSEHGKFEDFRYSIISPSDNPGKDRQIFTIELGGRKLTDDNGKVLGYRGIGRDVTDEANNQLILNIEKAITDIIQDSDDLSANLVSVIQKLCEMMNWRGGAHLEQVPGTQTLRMREYWGDDALRAMFEALPKRIPVAHNSLEAATWQGNGGVLPSAALSPAFAERYQMESLKIPSAFIAPIMDDKKKVLSALFFFTRTRLVQDDLLNRLARAISATMSQYIQRKRAEEKLLRASLHDALTDLPNRVYLAEQLDRRLAKKQPAALLYIDLDRYKAINDTLGHQAGDQVLVEVARRFRSTIGAGNIASRVGGDEFILLLDNMTDPQQVESIARKVLAATERPFILKGEAHTLSASIGIAMAPTHGTDAATLIKCADKAMYTVKSEGRNDVRFFSSEMKDKREESSPDQQADALPLAMERGEVELFYQPVISASDLQICGVEALIRWNHPVRGLLLPEQFLPSAERSNLMKQVGLWIIRRALDDRVKLGLDKYPDLVVSVNISPNQLNEEGFLAQVSSLLRERNMPPHLLRLELTENILIEGSSRTTSQLSALKRLGVQVMIDNFGTGYASMSYLKKLPISGLKIDQSFIHDLPTDRGNAAIVRSIMTLAQNLDMLVIAEGVGSTAELQILRELGCQMMQGHHLCKPLEFKKLEIYLHKRQKMTINPASQTMAV